LQLYDLGVREKALLADIEAAQQRITEVLDVRGRQQKDLTREQELALRQLLALIEEVTGEQDDAAAGDGDDWLQLLLDAVRVNRELVAMGVRRAEILSDLTDQTNQLNLLIGKGVLTRAEEVRYL